MDSARSALDDMIDAAGPRGTRDLVVRSYWTIKQAFAVDLNDMGSFAVLYHCAW